MMTFCKAGMQPGFELVAEAVKLEERIANCDLVITGEGRLDAQTGFGKAPAEVARLARKHGKKIAAVCGLCEEGAEAGFDFVVQLISLEENRERCIKEAARLVAEAGKRIGEWGL